MDFIVSKVAMSICALLVAGVIGSAMNPVLKPDHETELRQILAVLDRLFLELDSLRGACAAEFAVPSLPDGCGVRVSVEHDLLSASCAHALAFERPSVRVHTWYDSAGELNETMVEELDGAAQACVALTGGCLAVSLENRVMDGDSALMMFVWPEGEPPRSLPIAP